MPCARFLEADWATHGHVTRARDCHVVVTRSAARAIIIVVFLRF